jgi:hypothetical protein
MVTLAAGWLLVPVLPTTTYLAQWTPNLGNLEWYRGRVQRVELGGRTLRPRPIPEWEPIRASLTRGDRLVVDAIAGPPVPHLAPLFLILQADGPEVVMVGVDRDDVVYRIRTRAAWHGLDQPDIGFRGGLRGVRPGDSLRVAVWRRTKADWCIAVNRGERCGLGLSAGSAWGLLYYNESFAGWLRRLLDLTWLAALAIPVGIGLRPGWRGVLALGLLPASLFGGAAVFALRAPAPLDWSGAGLGVIIGLMIAGARRPRPGPERPRDATRPPVDPPPLPPASDEPAHSDGGRVG